MEQRYYNSGLGIWLSVDPMAGKYPSTSPYAYCRNNPIMLVDPNGMSDSPYYDAEGNFLGVDENGFSGEIFITTASAFKAHSKNGIANSKELQGCGDTKEFYNSRGSLSNNSINKILTNVINGTELPYGEGTLKEGSYNVYRSNATQYNGLYDGLKNGVHQFEFSTSDYEWTVENIKGLGIHEIWGHGIKGYGNETKNHRLIYQGQMDSKYWDKSTERYKSHTANTYYDYFRKETNSNKVPSRYFPIVNKYWK